MVAATETAPIERIPPQKDGGAENDRRSERPHGGPTASQPARQHHRCAACTAATPPLHSRTIAPPLHSPHDSPTAALPPKKQGGRKKLQPPIRYYLRPKRPLPRLRPCLPIGPAAVSMRPEALAEGASGLATIPLLVPEPALATAGLASASA